MRIKPISALSAVVASALWMSAADAATVTIGLQESGVNSGNIVTESSGTGSAAFAGAFGTFNLNSVFGATGSDILSTTAFNASSTGSGTLNVWVTAQGLISPTGLSAFLSGFTENTLSGSVVESTFVDPLNGLFTTTTSLSSATFTSNNTAVKLAFADVGSGPFSATELFTITAVGTGNFLSTIDLASATPLPGALPLLAGGLTGLWAWSRKRRPKQLDSARAA